MAGSSSRRVRGRGGVGVRVGTGAGARGRARDEGRRGGGACGGAWPRAGAGVAEGPGVRGGPGAGRGRARAEAARGSRRPVRDLRVGGLGRQGAGPPRLDRGRAVPVAGAAGAPAALGGGGSLQGLETPNSCSSIF